MITLVGYPEGYEKSNKRELHNFCRPASAALNIQCALPVAAPRLLTLRRVCCEKDGLLTPYLPATEVAREPPDIPTAP